MTDMRPLARPAVGWLLAGLVVSPASVGGDRGFDVLHVNDDYRQPVRIVAAEADIEAGWVRYVLHGPTGIFAVDLDPRPDGLNRMILDLTGLRRLESVSLTTPGGEYLELHAMRAPPRDGIAVTPDEDGFRIEFAGPGLAHLAPGGRLQIVDAWR